MNASGRSLESGDPKAGHSFNFSNVIANQQGSVRKLSIIASSLTLIAGAGSAVYAENHHAHSNNSIQTTSSVTAPDPKLSSTSEETSPTLNSSAASSTTATPSSNISNGSSSVQTSINNGKASVTVNGQSIDIPSNGTVTKSVPDINGNNTNVTVNVENNGSSVNTSTNSTSMNVNSSTNVSSSSDVDIHMKEGK